MAQAKRGLALLVLVLASSLSSACFEPDTNPGLECSPLGACPQGQTCQDGICYRAGTAPIFDASIDAVPFVCSTETLASGQDSATDLDAQDNDYVYWTGNAGTLVLRSPKVLGTLEVFHDTVDKHPFGVVTDDTHVYWTENDATGRVMRKPKDSLEADPAQELAIAQGEPNQLVVDDTYVYWSNRAAGTISRALKIGSAAEILLSAQGAPTVLALDATRLFWINSGTGQVMRAAKDGTGQQQLAGAQAGPTDLGLSADSVYWTATDDNELRSVGKGGGAARTEVSGQTGASTLSVGNGYLYWGNTGTGEIMRAEQGSMTPQQIVDGQSEPVSLHLEGGQLYWLNALDSANRLVRGSCNGL
jgi:hypothetical protein